LLIKEGKKSKGKKMNNVCKQTTKKKPTVLIRSNQREAQICNLRRLVAPPAGVLMD